MFESDKKELNDKIKAILSMKDDWMWISKNMTAKHYDKDVESLLRKKYDKKADKELLKCSNDHKYVDNKKKDDKWLLQVLKSEYYILGNVIKNIHDQVRTDKSIEDKIKETIEFSKQNIKDKKIEFDKLCINKYSEVSYIISNNGKVVIPIEPLPLTKDLQDEYDIVYNFDYPSLDDYKNYRGCIKSNEKYLVLNNSEEKLLMNIILKDGTFIPINKSKYTDKITDLVIFNDIDLFKLERETYEHKDKYENELMNYERTYSEKKQVFSKIIDKIASETYITRGNFDGVVEKGQTITFIINDGKINIVKSSNVYYKCEKGVVKGIKGSKIAVECRLFDQIKNIINDKIIWREHKKDKIYDLLEIDDNINLYMSLLTNYLQLELITCYLLSMRM